MTADTSSPLTTAKKTHEHPVPPLALHVIGVSKQYETAQGPLQVLKEATFSISPGESVALTGESGSGKSTILHLIAGLDHFDAGDIIVSGARLSEMDDPARAQLRRERVGVIFQQFNLIPSLKVRDNIAFQARVAGRDDEAWRRELEERLGLSSMSDRYPEQLSGGQQQRVAIGRALAGKPPLILADEPTGNLDAASGDEVMALTKDLLVQTGASLLMVTHSERLAGQLDRRLHLAGGRIA